MRSALAYAPESGLVAYEGDPARSESLLRRHDFERLNIPDALPGAGHIPPPWAHLRELTQIWMPHDAPVGDRMMTQQGPVVYLGRRALPDGRGVLLVVKLYGQSPPFGTNVRVELFEPELTSEGLPHKLWMQYGGFPLNQTLVANTGMGPEIKVSEAEQQVTGRIWYAVPVPGDPSAIRFDCEIAGIRRTLEIRLTSDGVDLGYEVSVVPDEWSRP
jgi:hypothetical protein